MRAGAIVPVSGFAPYLAETLDSVLACAPARVVVVDDGSRLPVVLHPDHADHVELVRREVPGGPAAARAAGLAVLDDVDAVALCDSDDAWTDAHLARSLDALASVGWTFGRADIVGPDGGPTGERWPEAAIGVHTAAALGARLYAANVLPTSSVVLRLDALADAGGFAAPVFVAEDWDLWLRLCAAGYDAVCVDSAIRYRRHPDGLTADVERLARAQLDIHARHAGLVDGRSSALARAADRRVLRRSRMRRLVPVARRDPYRR